MSPPFQNRRSDSMGDNPALHLPRLPRVGEEVYYIDTEKNLLHATVTRVYVDEFLQDCPVGTRFEIKDEKQCVRVPEGTTWGEVKLPRGYMIDLDVRVSGIVSSHFKVPYNPIQYAKTKTESLQSGTWVF